MKSAKFSMDESAQKEDLTAYSVTGNVVVLNNKNPVPNTKKLVLENPNKNQEGLATKEEYLEDAKTLTATKLGKKYPKTYSTWKNMKQRCKNGYVLDSRFEGFAQFLSLMGPRRGSNITLDRIDHTNPNYSPENCRWANKYTQNQNKSNNVLLTYNGVTLPASVWARKTKQKPDTVLHRVASGWTDEEAITGVRNSPAKLSMGDARKICLKKLPTKVLADVAAQMFYYMRGLHEELIDHYHAGEEHEEPVPQDKVDALNNVEPVYWDYIAEIKCRVPKFDIVSYASANILGIRHSDHRGTSSPEYKGHLYRLYKITGDMSISATRQSIKM